ncbi:MAG: signal recognition particle protein Srp19 [Candidatus Methanoliparum thermophilum]|uniref:Signal recognition particle 19 kDa protein n=1 Tax=Methanoliparum thermophilum TaxID=2491083 RepID=A0A520KRA5_METT2|nr:signal recognition particle subunit SRP19/SEC65 family protein [Candidatus Methanoliparum sp. LAM-1]RZN64148.1 MAG: signal recognition particle protein Srp19 [Candidatus Methanoliparum thermophilum]BDC35583.1 signal recognition particle protein Srp19 [Candidatus Methanoliparum sp. LAM-1]
MKKDKNIVLWPIYFDSTKARNDGRRVPRRLSVKRPIVDDIGEIAKKLGFDVILEKDKFYPKSWWEKSGRVIIINNTQKSKTNIIKEIAEGLKNKNK